MWDGDRLVIAATSRTARVPLNLKVSNPVKTIQPGLHFRNLEHKEELPVTQPPGVGNVPGLRGTVPSTPRRAGW